MKRRVRQSISILLLSVIMAVLVLPFYMTNAETAPYVPPDPYKAPDIYKAPDSYKAPDIYKAPDPYKAPDIYKAPDPHKAPDPYQAPDKYHSSGWEAYLNRLLDPYDNKYRDPNYISKIRNEFIKMRMKYQISFKQAGHRLIPRFDANGKLIGYYFDGKLDTKLQQWMSGLRPDKVNGQKVFNRFLPVQNQFNNLKAAWKHNITGGGTWGFAALGGVITASLEGHEKWQDWAASATVETVVGAASSAAGSAIGSALAGALASTALGASMGSAVPIVGTVIGAVAGIGIYALTNTSVGRTVKNWVKSGVKHALNAIVPNGVSDSLQNAYSATKSTIGGWVDAGKSTVSSVKDKVTSFVGKLF
ncbi:hypothetical protein [Laceyella putida]|uniref:Uncharacterized protein n=1 Tax=Laceyella putida TaxID=110101 RepID=A0ABW2RQN0_9BACL